MTTVSPYARLTVSDRVSIWGLAGNGTGDMTIVQAANDRGQPERITRTDLSMRLTALGGRGALLQAGETGDMDLALKTDAFFVEWSPRRSRTRAPPRRMRAGCGSSSKGAVRSGRTPEACSRLGSSSGFATTAGTRRRGRAWSSVVACRTPTPTPV